MTQRNVDYNEYATRVHQLNKKWWHDLEGNPIDRNKPEMFMLMVSELSEAMEGARKDLMDDHLPHRKMEEVEIADFMIRLLDFAGGFGLRFTDLQRGCHLPKTTNTGEQLFAIVHMVQRFSDVVLWKEHDAAEALLLDLTHMCECYCEQRGFNLWDAVDEKNEYNRTRADHKLENRKQEHGKKW